MARLCSCLPVDSPGALNTVQNMHRWLTLACLLCKARIRETDEGSDIATLVQLGLISVEERHFFEETVSMDSRRVSTPLPANGVDGDEEASSQAAPRTDRFPSKARTSLVTFFMWSELSRLLKDGTLHAQQFAVLEADVAHISSHYNRLDAMVAQILPFCYANYIKFVQS